MWKINVQAPFQGYLQKYYLENDMTVGENNQANSMSCIDHTRINSITTGFKPQAGSATSELVYALSNSDGTNHFGIGNTSLFKVSNSGTSTSDAYWPHTITGASGAGFLSNTIIYDGNLYYFWNSLTASNIGLCTAPSGTPVFDDDWGTTVASGTFYKLCNKAMIVNSNNYLVFGNGQYLGTYDGTTMDSAYYDFGTGKKVTSITEQSGYTYVSVNDENEKGKVFIFLSDFSSEDYADYISVGDKIGALYAINGVIYVFHEESIGQDLSKIGYISGNRVIDLPIYYDGSPLSKRIDFAGDVLFFNTDEETLGLSTPYDQTSFILSSPLEPKYGNTAALKSNSSYLLVASSDTTNHYISRYSLSNSGKGVNGKWKSKTWEVADIDNMGMIDSIEVKTKKLGSGGRCDLSVYINRETTAYKTIQIDDVGEIRHIFRRLNISGVKEFNFELDFSNGSSLVYIEQIKIQGHTYEI